MKLISVYPNIRRAPVCDPTNFDSLFKEFFHTRLPVFPKTNGFSKNPAVNVMENKDEFRIELAAPGLSKKDFDIDLDKNVLTISARQEAETKKEEVEYKLREFGFSQFKRVFHLPETVDSDAVKANLINGVLSLALPKKESTKTPPLRKIKVA